MVESREPNFIGLRCNLKSINLKTLKILAKKDAVIASDKKNVMTWIHGGTFNFGGIDVTYENPDNLVAENDIIVAKINYRLGESIFDN